jgi:rhodanese-related sulfurtransferase
MQISPKVHTTRFLALAQAVKNHIREITVQQLNEKLARKEAFYLLDVREESEFAYGCIPTALHLSKGIIEAQIEKAVPDVEAEIILYCSGGFRSALAADNLQKMGYTQVYSLNGGLRAWLNEGRSLQATTEKGA